MRLTRSTAVVDAPGPLHSYADFDPRRVGMSVAVDGAEVFAAQCAVDAGSGIGLPLDVTRGQSVAVRSVSVDVAGHVGDRFTIDVDTSLSPRFDGLRTARTVRWLLPAGVERRGSVLSWSDGDAGSVSYAGEGGGVVVVDGEAAPFASRELWLLIDDAPPPYRDHGEAVARKVVGRISSRDTVLVVRPGEEWRLGSRRAAPSDLELIASLDQLMVTPVNRETVWTELAKRPEDADRPRYVVLVTGSDRALGDAPVDLDVVRVDGPHAGGWTGGVAQHVTSAGWVSRLPFDGPVRMRDATVVLASGERLLAGDVANGPRVVPWSGDAPDHVEAATAAGPVELPVTTKALKWAAEFGRLAASQGNLGCQAADGMAWIPDVPASQQVVIEPVGFPEGSNAVPIRGSLPLPGHDKVVMAIGGASTPGEPVMSAMFTAAPFHSPFTARLGGRTSAGGGSEAEGSLAVGLFTAGPVDLRGVGGMRVAVEDNARPMGIGGLEASVSRGVQLRADLGEKVGETFEPTWGVQLGYANDRFSAGVEWVRGALPTGLGLHQAWGPVGSFRVDKNFQLSAAVHQVDFDHFVVFVGPSLFGPR